MNVKRSRIRYHFIRFPTYFLHFIDTYLHTFWSNSATTFNSILTHIANRCDTIRDWIRGGNASFTIWKRSDDRDAHLGSHFLRIMTRFLSRNRINTSGWARRLSLEKMIAQWKRERMENECCSRLSFPFFFFFFSCVCTSSNSLDRDAIIPLLGSRLSKMIRRLRSNTNFHAWVYSWLRETSSFGHQHSTFSW